MSLESGEHFEVVSIEGGFAVQPADTDVSQSLNPTSLDAGETEKTKRGRTAPFVHVIRPAWRSQVASFFVVGIGFLLMIAPTWPIALFSMEAMYQINESMPGIWQDISFLGFALVLVGLIVAWFRRYWRKSILTNTSLTQSTGIMFFRSTSVIELRNVHVVQVNKPNLVHMLLNLGTVELSTPGSAADDASIVDVVSPQKLADFVRRLMHDVHVKPT
ncbi:MAG: PH domain-containing protein [Pseudomonadota bacterium]